MQDRVGRALRWHEGSLGFTPLGLASSVQYFQGTQQIPRLWETKIKYKIKSKKLVLNLRTSAFCHASVADVVLHQPDTRATVVCITLDPWLILCYAVTLLAQLIVCIK